MPPAGGAALCATTSSLGVEHLQGRHQPVAHMLINSLVMASVIAVGKIAISILSAYAVVFFRFPLRQTCFWMIFITLMLPVEVRIVPTYKVVSDLGMVKQLLRPHYPAPCLGDGDAAVPAVLPHRAGRARRGGEDRRRRAAALLLGHRRAAARTKYRGALRHSLHLRLETSISGRLLITNSADMTTIVIGLKQMIAPADAQTGGTS